MPARFSRGPSGNRTRSPSLPRTCATRTPTDPSDPGWTRTIVFLVVTQVSSPLDYGIIFAVTEVGVEPTKSPGSRPDRFTYLRTPSLRVRVSHPAGEAYETSLSTGPPAIKLQAPVSSRAHRPHEGQLGTCQACISDEGESRTPTPQWARHSECRVSTSFTTSS
jgi:hypothetical protein